MRDVLLRIERNGAFFDVLVKDQDGEETLEKITAEQLRNLARSLVNKAMESLD